MVRRHGTGDRPPRVPPSPMSAAPAQPDTRLAWDTALWLMAAAVAAVAAGVAGTPLIPATMVIHGPPPWVQGGTVAVAVGAAGLLGMLLTYVDRRCPPRWRPLTWGFALGYTSASQESPNRLSSLAGHAQRYQRRLQDLDDKARAQLLKFSSEIMAALRYPMASE